MTQTQKIYGIVLGIAIVVTLGTAWYLIDTKKALAPETGTLATTTAQTNATSTSGSPTITGVVVDSSGANGNVKPVNIKDLPAAPSFSHQAVFDPSLSPEVKKALEARIDATKANLKKIPYSLEDWIGLGVYYKEAGDYAAAKEAWIYAGLISPGNTVSFSDLGNLEQYYLHDYPNAEKHFMQVIANDKNYVLGYLNLSDLYRLSYQMNTTKGADVLKQGLKVVPNNIDMTVALAVFYAGKNDTVNAKTYYAEAIALAKAQHNDTLANSLTVDMNALK